MMWLIKGRQCYPKKYILTAGFFAKFEKERRMYFPNDEGRIHKYERKDFDNLINYRILGLINDEYGYSLWRKNIREARFSEEKILTQRYQYNLETQIDKIKEHGKNLAAVEIAQSVIKTISSKYFICREWDHGKYVDKFVTFSKEIKESELNIKSMRSASSLMEYIAIPGTAQIPIDILNAPYEE